MGLREFIDSNPWFPSLVAGMLSNQLVDPRAINTKLDNLSSKQAFEIGTHFSSAVRDRLIAEAGADMFLNDHPALIAFTKRHSFFLPMTIIIGQRKLEQAPWGLAFNVGIGAVLGILDVATDLNSIYAFKKDGKHTYANACIAMISFSMAIQLLVIYVRGKKRGAFFLAKEALIVLSGFKPAVDAWRVVGGAKVGFEDTFDPHFEMIVVKSIEV